MSIEAQYYFIPVVSFAVFIYCIWLVHRFIKKQTITWGVRIALWIGTLLLSSGLSIGLGLMMLFVFAAKHPMDPPMQ